MAAFRGLEGWHLLLGWRSLCCCCPATSDNWVSSGLGPILRKKSPFFSPILKDFSFCCFYTGRPQPTYSTAKHQACGHKGKSFLDMSHDSLLDLPCHVARSQQVCLETPESWMFLTGDPFKNCHLLSVDWMPDTVLYSLTISQMREQAQRGKQHAHGY